MPKKRSNELIGRKKSVHPATVYRKRLRRKEIQRNKEQREEQRDKAIETKDEATLRADIKKLDILKKKNKLNPYLKGTHTKLQEALKNIIKTKKNKKSTPNETPLALQNNQLITTPMKTNILPEIAAQLDSLETDHQPFFPPGLSIPSHLIAPPGNFAAKQQLHLHSQSHELIGTASVSISPQIHSTIPKEYNEIKAPNNKNSSTQNITMIKNIAENANKRQKQIKHDLMDPLNPSSNRYLTSKIAPTPKPTSPLRSFVISKEKTGMIGPQFGESGHSSESNSVVYSRQESIVKVQKEIPKETLRMVPAVVQVRRKSNNTQEKTIQRKSLAPEVGDLNNGTPSDYDKFINEIHAKYGPDLSK